MECCEMNKKNVNTIRMEELDEETLFDEVFHDELM